MVEALSPKRYGLQFELRQVTKKFHTESIEVSSSTRLNGTLNQIVTARSSHILNSGESDSSKSSSGGSSGYHSFADSATIGGQGRFDLPAIRKAVSVDCLLVKRDLFRSSRDLREFRYDSHCISCLSQIWNSLEKLS